MEKQRVQTTKVQFPLARCYFGAWLSRGERPPDELRLGASTRPGSEMSCCCRCGQLQRTTPGFICPCSPSWAGPGREGNPDLGNRMYLISQNGLCLVIDSDGNVKGSHDTEEYGLLEISSIGFNNEVRLRGVKSGLFLAMDERGRLYGEINPESAATLFLSGVNGAYNIYQSKAHAGEENWYVGLRRKGEPKPGPLTRPEQKAARFLPLRPDNSSGVEAS